MATPVTLLIERLAAISQNGLAYTRDPYDRVRYEELRGVAAELLKALGAEPATFERLYSNDVGYRTPKLSVRAFAVRENSVLLVRERGDGRWSLPGGWADIGDPKPMVSVSFRWTRCPYCPRLASRNGNCVRCTNASSVVKRLPSSTSVFPRADSRESRAKAARVMLG